MKISASKYKQYKFYVNYKLIHKTNMESSIRFAFFKNKYDEETIYYCKEVIAHIKNQIPNAEFFVQEGGQVIGNQKLFDQKTDIDYVVVVGGDGTMSHTVSKFTQKSTPPIFGLGKGQSFILYNYRVGHIKTILPHFIQKVKKNTVSYDNSIRLKMTKKNLKAEEQIILSDIAMSEILIHRGKNPSSLRMEIFINDILLTTFFGDGMIFSTPMGSMGYSLSSMGPILNHETSTIILVPICPLSLSFRPICIPDSSQIKIRLLEKSRSSGVTSCDGRKQIQFLRGEEIIIEKSEYTAKIVTGITDSKEAVWIDKLKSILKWGNQFCA